MLQKIMALYKKELKVFFAQPVAYVLIAVFIAISGYFFAGIAANYADVSLKSMNNYQRSMIDMNMLDGIFRPFFYNLAFILLFVAPALTMRVFAEEKREGTAELLFTMPVTDFSLLISKFAAVMTVFLMMLSGALTSFVILMTAAPFDILPVLSGMLGITLVAAAFVSLGIFISSMTENQVVSAVISFTLLLFFWIIEWLGATLGPGAAKVLSAMSVIKHFDSFSKGLLDTGDMAYYLIFIFIFGFFTLRSLESKKWRG